MTRGEALKDFFRKTILPAALAALLYCIFRSACVKNGELDYLWLWILCGLPFGIWRLRLWIIPGGGSLGGGIALFLLNFVFSEHHICTWISIERKITVTIRICMNKGKSGMIFFVQNQIACVDTDLFNR